MDQNLFGGAPRFLTRPKAFAVCVGKDATLSCTIVGNPTPLITWEKEKLRLTSGGRFKMVDDGDVYRLTIYDLTLEDSGQYMCRAKNNVGEAYACVTLHVGLPQEMVERAPVFMVKPTSARVGLGGDVVFHCRVAAYPEPKFDWEKDGRYLAETNRIKVTSDSDSSSLRIQSVRSLDSGTYTCRAQNSVGHGLSLLGLDHSSAALVSHLPKGVFTRTCTVTEGKHAKLSCFVTGHPKPHIIWRKDGGNIGEGRRQIMYEDQAENFILKILYCKQRDNGLYTCNASNMAGHTYSAVLVIVKEPKVPFRRKLQDVEVQEKMTATLLCEVPISTTQASWFMEETRLEDCSKYRMEEEGTMRRLTIHNVTTNDDAVYICEMKEGSRTVAELTVLGNITKKLPRRTVVPVSDTVIFCVELEHPCSDAYWTRNAERLKPDTRILIACTLRQYTLTISHCQADDSGEVAFMAGDCKTSTRFSVTGEKHPPDPPIDVVVRNKTDSSITLHWSPPDSDRPVPIKGYIVERRKVGAQTWQRCNGMEISPFTEITIQNFTEEASYQFRISAVNNYGQSQYLEVPGTFYLEPSAEVKTGLMNSTAISGEEASLSVDLSAVCSGFWSINGRLLRSGGDYLITRQKTTHTLMIRTVLMEMNGALVDYDCYACQCYPCLSSVECPSMIDSVQREVKAILSQKATLSCDVSDTKTEVKWYKDGKLLTSKKVEKKDAGQYTCEVGAEKLVFKIQVTGMQELFFMRATLSQKATLSCELLDTKTEVKWYKDGKLLTSTKTVHMLSMGKACHVMFLVLSCTSIIVPSETQAAFTNKDSVQKEVRATLSQKATLSCEVSDTKTEVKWYKDGKLLTSSKTVSMETKGKTRQLVIEKVEKKDAGHYTCEVGAEKLAFKIQVTGMGRFQSWLSVDVFLKVLEAGWLSMYCVCTEVKWYKDGKLLTSSKTVSMETKGKTRQLVIEKVEKKDAGQYTCEVGAEKLVFKIQVTGMEDMKAGCLLMFLLRLCRLNGPKQDVKWYKDGKLLTSSKTVSMETKGKTRQLVIEKVEKKDAGQYTCEVGAEKLVYEIQVTGMMSLTHSTLGVTLTLTCELNQASGDVLWRHNSREVKPGGSTCEGLESLAPDCACARATTAPRLVNLTSKLSSIAAVEGKDVVFKCSVTPADVKVKWFRNNVPITSGPKYKIEHRATSHSLTITSVSQEDAGEISMAAEGKTCSATLQVQRKNQPLFALTLTLQNVTTVEDQKGVKLEVELSRPSKEVRWMKNSVVLQPGDNMDIRVDGAKQTLVFKSVTTADRGYYSCETLDDKTQAKLTVDVQKIEVVKGLLAEVKANEKETVTLEVELSQADVEGSWTKSGAKLKAGSNCRITALGKKHALTLSQLKMEDAGTIVFQAEGVKSSGKLIVAEPAAMISRPMKDVKAPEKEKATLECEVSRTNAEVKWFKVRKHILVVNHRTRTSSHAKRESVQCQQFTLHNCVYKVNFYMLLWYCLVWLPCIDTVVIVTVELPVQFVKKLRDKLAMHTHRGFLQCQMSRASAKVKWYKNKKEIKSSKKHEISSKSIYRKLTINDVGADDEDNYTCNAIDDKTSCKLVVEGNGMKIRTSSIVNF
uniref:Obscurin, cytoskeletal calmodulin and titin-interacting RhoGEF b n=1 Tax=Salmo trutta TaxID=8032 RepID=A0A673XYP7_SALTR